MWYWTYPITSDTQYEEGIEARIITVRNKERKTRSEMKLQYIQELKKEEDFPLIEERYSAYKESIGRQ